MITRPSQQCKVCIYLDQSAFGVVRVIQLVRVVQVVQVVQVDHVVQMVQVARVVRVVEWSGPVHKEKKDFMSNIKTF